MEPVVKLLEARINKLRDISEAVSYIWGFSNESVQVMQHIAWAINEATNELAAVYIRHHIGETDNEIDYSVLSDYGSTADVRSFIDRTTCLRDFNNLLVAVCKSQRPDKELLCNEIILAGADECKCCFSAGIYREDGKHNDRFKQWPKVTLVYELGLNQDICGRILRLFARVGILPRQRYLQHVPNFSRFFFIPVNKKTCQSQLCNLMRWYIYSVRNPDNHANYPQNA